MHLTGHEGGYHPGTEARRMEEGELWVIITRTDRMVKVLPLALVLDP